MSFGDFNDSRNQFPANSGTVVGSMGAISSQSNGHGHISGIGIGSSSSTAGYQYSTPELMGIIITDKTIEHVYKRYCLIWGGYGHQQPEVYKEVYSRFDGSMKIVKGNYSSPQPEGYFFNDEEEQSSSQV